MPYIDTKYIGQCETCRNHSNSGCNTYCDHGEEYSPDLSKIPTADVVPREDADRLLHILNSYALQYGTAKDQREVIDRIKKETAREIFECLDPSFAIGEFTGSDVFYAIRAEDYNRCKKKYTEENT